MQAWGGNSLSRSICPTTAADTTAELGCGMMPPVSCDPSGWDQGCASSRAAGPALCRSREGVSLLPQAPRCRIPFPPHTSSGGGANSHFSNRMFLCPLAPDWQDLEQLPTGVRDCGRTKRGCEKLLLCLMEQAATFRTLKQVLVFFLTAARRRFLLRCSTIRLK